MVDQVAAAAGIFAPDEPQETALNLPKGLLKALSTKPLVCIHPSMSSSARSGVLEACAQLIDLLLTGADVNVALIGSPEDREPAARLLSRDDGLAEIRGRLFDLVGRLSSSEVPALLARAALYVGPGDNVRHQLGTLGSADPVFVPPWWMLRNSGRRDLAPFIGCSNVSSTAS
jgi:hypothetical protein